MLMANSQGRGGGGWGELPLPGLDRESQSSLAAASLPSPRGGDVSVSLRGLQQQQQQMQGAVARRPSTLKTIQTLFRGGSTASASADRSSASSLPRRSPMVSPMGSPRASPLGTPRVSLEGGAPAAAATLPVLSTRLTYQPQPTVVRASRRSSMVEGSVRTLSVFQYWATRLGDQTLCVLL